MATATATRKNGNGTANAVHASDVEAQIEKLREDIASLTQTVAAYGAGKVDKYADKAEKAGTNIAEASQNALKDVAEEVKSVEKDVEARVRDKPLQALGIAAGIGFLLAVMARR